jgi:hypothetical protein
MRRRVVFSISEGLGELKIPEKVVRSKGMKVAATFATQFQSFASVPSAHFINTEALKKIGNLCGDCVMKERLLVLVMRSSVISIHLDFKESVPYDVAGETWGDAFICKFLFKKSGKCFKTMIFSFTLAEGKLIKEEEWSETLSSGNVV